MRRTPYPIKEFRNAAMFPHADAEGVAWRWEFLRRHPDYQLFYERHAGRELTRTERAQLLEQFGAERLDDPMLDANSVSAPARSGTVVPLVTERNVGGIEGVGDPGTTTRPERMAFSINRTLPLEPQFEKIRRAVERANAAERMSTSVGNANRSAWPDYLRVLDAKAAEATNDEIAAVIYPGAPNEYPEYIGRDRARKAAKQAMNLLHDFAVSRFKSEE
jgi:hypothetical protein